MTDDFRARGASAEPALDEEAIGIDRPGLHSKQGDRPQNETFGDVLARNIARRSFLLGLGASVPVLMTASAIPGFSSDAEAAGAKSVGKAAASADKLRFTPISPSRADEILVPKGYTHDILLSWGQPLFPNAPSIKFENQTVKAQEKQFGYNCDFVGFFPLGDKRGLLCVNHEYTTGGDMFPDYVAGAKKSETDVEMAAHGGSVVEIKRDGDRWKVVKSREYNRRITATTPMEITGPAAGHDLMKTSEDPNGTEVLGMLNNCSGGKTPWGTWLTCEENFNQYFGNNDLLPDGDVKDVHSRYGVTGGATGRKWEAFYDRFDLTKEPNEPFRFGWVVEIDPYDPDFKPRKRTSLGRAKHEAATTALTKDGRVAVYTGDDQQFDYVYKFVSKGKVKKKRENNFDLLDKGTLYVAKLSDDNTGEWIELSMKNPTLASLFESDGEILIKTRLAADAVGATAMDRPEDVQPNPVSGKVYLTMTNNSARTTVRPDAGETAANPRVPNFNGHIVELTEAGNDHGATTFKWEIFLLCGNPEIALKTEAGELTPGLASNATFFAGYADATKLGKVASPDNIAFDSLGNLWIATDGQPSSSDIGNPNDAMHVVPTDGPDRGYLRQFMSGPRGCEVCGPEFTPDDKTLFAAIQHPGENGGYPNTISNWPPDNKAFPRPAVIAVRRKNGGRVGS